jgi:cytochrome P450
MTDIHDDVAPQLDGYDPTNPMEFVNPFPSWARARVEAPVFFNEILRMLASHPIRGHRTSGTQYQGLQLLGLLLNCEYLRENRDFIPNGPAIWTHALVNADPPTHTRVRKVSDPAFRKSRISGLEDSIRTQATELIDLRGEGGRRQLEGAKVGLAHVIGLGSACGPHILEKSAVA